MPAPPTFILSPLPLPHLHRLPLRYRIPPCGTRPHLPHHASLTYAPPLMVLPPPSPLFYIAAVVIPPSSLMRPVLTPTAEVEMVVRMLVAIACGAVIGIERRSASANAGVRTLSLVSLGSAVFALVSLHGLGGDPSRMAAAISTGIGFLGSGAINGDGGGSRRQLVTAASIWIAAAVGVAAAAGLFRLAVIAAVFTISILRWQLAFRAVKSYLKNHFFHTSRRSKSDDSSTLREVG